MNENTRQACTHKNRKSSRTETLHIHTRMCTQAHTYVHTNTPSHTSSGFSAVMRAAITWPCGFGFTFGLSRRQTSSTLFQKSALESPEARFCTGKLITSNTKQTKKKVESKRRQKAASFKAFWLHCSLKNHQKLLKQPEVAGSDGMDSLVKVNWCVVPW